MKKNSIRVIFLVTGLTASDCLLCDPFQDKLSELSRTEENNAPDVKFICEYPRIGPKVFKWEEIDTSGEISKTASILNDDVSNTKYKNCIFTELVNNKEYKVEEKTANSDSKLCNIKTIDEAKDTINKKVKYYSGAAIFVFDETQLCFYEYRPRKASKDTESYNNNSKLAVGDDIYIATVGDIAANFDACTQLSYRRPIDDGDGTETLDNSLKLNSQTYNCNSVENKLIVKKGGELKYEATISQQERYRATFQIGIVRTSITDQTFTTFDYGGGAVIRAEKDENKYPLYAGSLVLYGLPHYITNLTKDDSTYLGRDLLNDNQFLDRVGLAFTFGLSKPEDLLGIGLTFELASGINLTYSKLWKKVNVLDGYKVGDQYSGAANTIPTKETWNDENVAGISIDGRYLSKFFSSGK